MDFIERIWGISPDGGSGALEALIIAVFVIVAVTGVQMRRRMRAGRLRHPD